MHKLRSVEDVRHKMMQRPRGLPRGRHYFLSMSKPFIPNYEELCKRSNLRPFLRIMTIVLLYAFVSYIGFTINSFSSWIFICSVLGVMMTSLFVLVHESTHGTLFKTPFLNTIVGTIAATLTFDNYYLYKKWHWQHHQNTCTHDDSEISFSFSSLRDYLIQFVTYIPTLSTFPHYRLILQQEYPTSWRIRYFFAWSTVALWAGVVFGLFVVFPFEILALYIIPLCISFKIIFFTDVAEHYGLCESSDQDVLQTTRTTISNKLFSYFYFNANYHTVHHAYPRVSYFNVPVVYEYIQTHIEHKELSYLQFHIRIIKSLIAKK